jgi:hypothetical protein
MITMPTEQLKHTPGPWEFDRNNHGRDLRDGYGILDSFGCALGVHVTDAGDLDRRRKAAEVEANCRLIAAAPDLLNGCKATLGLIQLWAGRNDAIGVLAQAALDDNHRVHEAVDAIIKATGIEP